MRVCAISDTHCQLGAIEEKLKKVEADLLIHAGDLTYRGNLSEMSDQLRILGRIGKYFKHGAVFTCGNHDWLGEREPELLRCLAYDNGLKWLQDDLVEIEGVKIYGSAYTLEFCGWAFNMDRHDGTPEETWARIPEGVDILVTHGPSYGNMDHHENGNLGCRALGEAIARVKPQAHVFGHIHHAYGEKTGADGIRYVNASVCTEQYNPTNEPIVFEIEKRS